MKATPKLSAADIMQRDLRECINHYAKMAIEVLGQHIEELGYKPVVHFEIEGTYYVPLTERYKHALNFVAVNIDLKNHLLQGILKPEFWPCQWEWASSFEGQTPLKTASDLDQIIMLLPAILKKHGATDVAIKPVTWNAAEGRMMQGSRNVFSANQLPVHIPNSIQLNISALNSYGENALPINGLGEHLQQCLISTSRECCLIYACEEEAFDRLTLKQKFALSQELSSPEDISGGHQGSIALYKERGKHNQKLGETSQLYDAEHNVVTAKQHWQPLSRVEHRLGSASIHYNSFVNTAFALASLSDAILLNLDSSIHAHMRPIEMKKWELPQSLLNGDNNAYDLFRDSTWFENKISACAELTRSVNQNSAIPIHLGTLLKRAILEYYSLKIPIP